MKSLEESQYHCFGRIMEREEIVNRIVDLEYEMFDATNNVGGRASCQDNRPTFEIMRRAQFSAWDEATLNSYLADIETEKSKKGNLVTLKYAYMMKYTDPEKYKEFENVLPKISAKKEELVDELIKINNAWGIEFSGQYPNVASRGRRNTKEEERGMYPSVETYARGEMLTYSEETLTHLLNLYKDEFAKGDNLRTKTVETEMKMYGYESLDDVEASLAK